MGPTSKERGVLSVTSLFHSEKPRPWWRRKRTYVVVLLVVFMFTWWQRKVVLRAIGAVLIDQDHHLRGDVLYVLGGAPFDRGTHAAKLMEQGVAPIAYCTGSGVSQSYKAEGRSITEADLTREAAVRAGASATAVLPFRFGTSTFEEAQGILRHAVGTQADTLIILSTDFHTRRVRAVFEERFKGSGIHVLIASAPSTEYSTDRWWTSEQGLLMVNNEYVKTLFYALKY